MWRGGTGLLPSCWTVSFAVDGVASGAVGSQAGVEVLDVLPGYRPGQGTTSK